MNERALGGAGHTRDTLEWEPWLIYRIDAVSETANEFHGTCNWYKGVNVGVQKPHKA